MPNIGLDLALWIAETLLKASVVIGIAGYLAYRLRGRLPSGSHFVWVVAFCAIAALPFIANWLPRTTFVTVAPSIMSNSDSQPIAPRSPTESGSPQSAIATLKQGASSVKVGSRWHDPYALPFWFECAVGIWLIGFASVLGRTLFGLYSLRIIRKYGTHSISSDSLADLLDRLAGSAGVKRSWDLRISATSELALPMTWGILRPTVVLPQEADHWPPGQFEAVLLHELAHVRRFDFLSQLMAEVSCAIYWFHPFVWLGARAMRSDAELSADEAVLRTGLKPSDYASELLKLAARLGNGKQAFAYVGTPAMNNSKIETRLLSVLRYPTGRRGMSSVQVLASCAAVSVLIPALASLHATAAKPGHQDQTESNTQDVAKTRLKQAALAGLMYANDYDSYFPYVQQTASAAIVMSPYVKDKKDFESPTPGGRFLFNMNIAGVSTNAIEQPAITPMWWEPIAKSTEPSEVAFSDGHVKSVGQVPLKTFLGVHVKRELKMRPLPLNYLISDKHE